MATLVDRITWYGHDAFRIDDPAGQIYIDPWHLPEGLPAARLILVSHEHHDHYSPDDIARITGPDTLIICPADLAAKIGERAKALAPGQLLAEAGLTIAAIPAYNLNKKFHLREKQWVGFVITLSDGSHIYHAGDTDATPEMKALRDIDVALLPVSGTYVSTAAEVAEAANAFKPTVVIPMHYGTIVGSEDDAETFKKLFTGQTVIKSSLGVGE